MNTNMHLVPTLLATSLLVCRRWRSSRSPHRLLQRQGEPARGYRHDGPARCCQCLLLDLSGLSSSMFLFVLSSFRPPIHSLHHASISVSHRPFAYFKSLFYPLATWFCHQMRARLSSLLNLVVQHAIFPFSFFFSFQVFMIN